MPAPTQASIARRYPILGAVVRAIGDRLHDRAVARTHIAQMQAFSEEEFAGVARDLKMSRYELRLAMALSPGFVDVLSRRMALLLARRLAAQGIDRQRLRQTNRPLLQSLAMNCAGCVHHQRCEQDLDRDAADPAWTRYCPNSKAIDTLQAA